MLISTLIRKLFVLLQPNKSIGTTMNYFKITLLSLLSATLVPTTAWAQKNKEYHETSPEFFASAEARRIGDQLLLWQRNTGGWPKNVDMCSPMSEDEREQVMDDKNRTDDSTTDNGATTTQMTYLARLWQQTCDNRYRDAFRRGVEYLLSGQYENGGWPQFWPKMRDYQIHITYNDDAMVNTLTLLRDIRDGHEPYQNLSDEELNARLSKAFDKGIECILNTQIRVGDTLTVWCQQHDRETFLPAPARAFELASYCSAESALIVRLLMELPNPDERIQKAVDGAMAWFERHKITGYRLVRTGKKGEPGADTRLVADSTASPLWARYYDLEHCQPFVCDRDGVPRKSLQDIGPERRNGYSWYNDRPQSLLKKYAKWKKKLQNQKK